MGKERLLASDFDGTLNFGGIHETELQSLKEWKNRGNYFAVVSGRGIPDLVRLMEENRVAPDFLVGDNGASLADGRGTVLCENGCSGDIAPDLVKYLFSLGCDWATLRASSFEYYVKPDGFHCADWEIPLCDLPSVPYFTQVSTSLRTPEETVRVIGRIRERFGEILNPLQNACCIDIVRKNMNKAEGISRLIRRIGVSPENVVTVGDNVNDVDMIRAFPSYGMENGVDEVKKIAGRTVPDVEFLIRKLLEEHC